MSGTYSPANAPRTRCPGPELERFQPLASGTVARAPLGRSSSTLRLGGSGSFGDDGYVVSQRTRLTLTLKRAPVREQSS